MSDLSVSLVDGKVVVTNWGSDEQVFSKDLLNAGLWIYRHNDCIIVTASNGYCTYSIISEDDISITAIAWYAVEHKPLPEKALDFLDCEIKAGDTIVYPTGGTSCRMVLAVVKSINLVTPHRDGTRGHSPFTLSVNRFREGPINTERVVTLNQLHRVVVV